MSTEPCNPNDTIGNLAIGKIIEVDGSHIVAELEPKLSELSRVYAGETYQSVSSALSSKSILVAV